MDTPVCIFSSPLSLHSDDRIAKFFGGLKSRLSLMLELESKTMWILTINGKSANLKDDRVKYFLGLLPRNGNDDSFLRFSILSSEKKYPEFSFDLLLHECGFEVVIRGDAMVAYFQKRRRFSDKWVKVEPEFAVVAYRRNGNSLSSFSSLQCVYIRSTTSTMRTSASSAG